MCLSVALLSIVRSCLIQIYERSSQVFTASIIILIESVADHGYSSEAMLVCGTLAGYLIICSSLTIGNVVVLHYYKLLDF